MYIITYRCTYIILPVSHQLRPNIHVTDPVGSNYDYLYKDLCVKQIVLYLLLGMDLTLHIEAEEVIKEVSYAVKSVQISSVLPNSPDLVYLNLETKENKEFCVELSVRGFRVVSTCFDKIQDLEFKFYETIYALLDDLSPEYRNTFGDTLAMKLRRLQQKQNEDTQ